MAEAPNALDEKRVSEAEGYRQAIVTHLTSWVQDLTEIEADPEKTDSASVALALRLALDKVKALKPDPAEDVIGADGVLMLESAAHLMFRASQYAGVELASEWRCARAAATVMDEAYRDIKSWQRFSTFGRAYPHLRIR